MKYGDIVFIQDVLNNDFIYIYDDKMLKAVKKDIETGLEITEVLTHEQYETNCYKIETGNKSKDEFYCCNCGAKLNEYNKALNNMCKECKYGIDWEE